MSDQTLQFPKAIAEEIGLHENEINSFKGKGCRFYGKKTCVAWVREYLCDITKPAADGPGAGLSVHPPHSIESKLNEPVLTND